MNSKIVGIHSNDEVVPSPIDGEHAYVSYETLSADLDEIKNILDESESVDKAIDEESAVQIGFDHKTVSSHLPMVVTPAGVIKKFPGYKRGRTVEDLVKYGQMVGDAKRVIGDGHVCMMWIDAPFGRMLLNPEYVHYFDVNEMFIDLATKGWKFTLTRI